MRRNAEKRTLGRIEPRVRLSAHYATHAGPATRFVAYNAQAVGLHSKIVIAVNFVQNGPWFARHKARFNAFVDLLAVSLPNQNAHRKSRHGSAKSRVRHLARKLNQVFARLRMRVAVRRSRRAAAVAHSL